MKNNGIKYIINKDNNTVVAKFDKVFYVDENSDSSIWYELFLNTVEKINRVTSMEYYLDDVGCPGFGMDNTQLQKKADVYLNQLRSLCGVAKCNPMDEFDEETGKKVARNKLLSKYSKFEKYMLQYIYEKSYKCHEEYLRCIRKRMNLCDYKVEKASLKNV